jgi:hypothetical protein
MNTGFTRRACRTLAIGLVALASAHEVFAQFSSARAEAPGVRRPYRGLFGGAQDPSKPHTLDLTGSLYAAYDDNVLAGLSNSLLQNWRFQRSGYYGGAQAGLSYGIARSGRRWSIGAQTAAFATYHHSRDAAHLAPYYQGAVQADVRLARQTTLAVAQRVSYLPTYRASFLPGHADEPAAGAPESDVLPVIDPDLELFRLEAIRSSSSVVLSQGVGRHLGISGRYDYRLVDFGDEVEGSRFRNYRSHGGGASIRYDRPVSAHAVLNLGYGIRGTQRSNRSGQPPLYHDVTAGVSYSRALSFSRRTSVSLATGSALGVRDSVVETERVDHRRTVGRLTGNASLVHELGRTWTAQARYARGFVFREDFADQFYFVDSVTMSIGGLPHRRLSVAAGAVWATSTLERAGRNRSSRLSSSAQATFALNRYLAAYARYVYYAYDYGADVPLDPRLPRKLDRQGVRVGLTTWIPLIR